MPCSDADRSPVQSHKSWRPVTTLSFWINHYFAQLDPLPYHAVNIVVHGLNVLLVGLVAVQVFSLTPADAAGPVRWMVCPFRVFC